jgi:hypothetical protein
MNGRLWKVTITNNKLGSGNESHSTQIPMSGKCIAQIVRDNSLLWEDTSRNYNDVYDQCLHYANDGAGIYLCCYLTRKKETN